MFSGVWDSLKPLKHATAKAVLSSLVSFHYTQAAPDTESIFTLFFIYLQKGKSNGKIISEY